MRETRPRKAFKKSFGQANHFIITALVALNAIECGDLKEVPEELHTSWSPKDREQSARRTRKFILNTTLLSAVDATDVYLTRLWRAPKWISGVDVEHIYSSAGRSVYRKATELSSLLKISDVTKAMIEVVITWRNNVMHELADNTLSQSSSNTLRDKRSEFESQFCGLDPSLLEQKANEGRDLTFKETTSLIRGTHMFVREVDAMVINRLSMDQFIQSIFINRLNSCSNLKAKFFGSTYDRRLKIVKNVIQEDLGVADTSTVLASAVLKLATIKARDCKNSQGES